MNQRWSKSLQFSAFGPDLVGVVPDADVDGDRVSVVVQLSVQGSLEFKLA